MSELSEEERRAVEELLPWYAAGTLSRAEMRRVEAAIARDPQLARDYESVREERAGTVHVNESLGAPSARAMEKLFANIDAEPARRPAHVPSIAERLSIFMASLSPRSLAWSASAVAVVVLLQTAIIGGVLINRQSEFQTASGPSNAPSDGAFAIVQFAPGTSIADISKLLQDNNLTLAGGPTGGNLYRLRLGAAGLSKEDIARLLERLQQDKAVSFIAPAE